MATTRAHLSLTISVGNAATQQIHEVAAIIHAAADRLSGTAWSSVEGESLPLRDYNGNVVGHLAITGYSVEDEEADEN